MLASIGTSRLRPLLFSAVFVALAGVAVQAGGVIALFNGNLGHVALLKAQLSGNTIEQQQLLGSAQRHLAASLPAGTDSQAYVTAQLALAPLAGCPQPALIGLVSPQFTLGEDSSHELATWIETKSVIPVCLGAGRPDYAAGYYTWANEQFAGLSSYYKQLPSQMATEFVVRALARYEGGDKQGGTADWTVARSYLSPSPYETFGDIVEKKSSSHRTAQQQLLALDVMAEPQNNAARIYLAQAYNATGQADQALEAIVALLSSTPPDTRVWQQYGQALIGLHRLAEAGTALRKAVELAPGDLSALNRLGVLYLATDKPQQAEGIFRQAVTAPGADNAYWLWEHLGDALLAQDRRQEAADAYREAIKVAPAELSASASGKLAKLDR